MTTNVFTTPTDPAQRTALAHYDRGGTMPKLVDDIARTAARVVAEVNRTGYTAVATHLNARQIIAAKIAGAIGQLADAIKYLPDSALATVGTGIDTAITGLLTAVGGFNPGTFRRLRAPVAIASMSVSQGVKDALAAVGYVDDEGVLAAFRQSSIDALPAAFVAVFSGQSASVPAYMAAQFAAWLVATVPNFPTNDAASTAAYIMELA